jgi:hypothetical protein
MKARTLGYVCRSPYTSACASMIERQIRETHPPAPARMGQPACALAPKEFSEVQRCSKRVASCARAHHPGAAERAGVRALIRLSTRRLAGSLRSARNPRESSAGQRSGEMTASPFDCIVTLKYVNVSPLN